MFDGDTGVALQEGKYLQVGVVYHRGGMSFGFSHHVYTCLYLSPEKNGGICPFPLFEAALFPSNSGFQPYGKIPLISCA